jgi:hypothetical protein
MSGHLFLEKLNFEAQSFGTLRIFSPFEISNLKSAIIDSFALSRVAADVRRRISLKTRSSPPRHLGGYDF